MDLGEIAEWVYDGYDDLDVYLYIDYVPMTDVVRVKIADITEDSL